MRRREFVAMAGAGIATPALCARAVAMDGPVNLRDLYNRDRSFSDLALSLEGRRITVDGFMATPLKADAKFFVLTKMPMAVCPFCNAEAEGPEGILAVYIKRSLKVIPFNISIAAEGVLELGSLRDEATGFLSMVRLVNATYG